MSPPPPSPPSTYRITLLPPPGPAVLSLRPPFPPHPTDESTPQLFHDALAIRRTVFGLEQSCPEDEEIEADDAVGWHWVLYARDGEEEGGKVVPAATVRLVPARKMGLDGGGGEHASGGGEGVSEGPDYENSSVWDLKEPFAGIGRVATMRAFRGRGYGRVLVEEALRWAGGHGGDVGRGLRGEGEGWKGLLLIHAQVVVEGWYRGLGWRTDEGMGRWDEVGIMHVGMWKRVEVLGG